MRLTNGRFYTMRSEGEVVSSIALDGDTIASASVQDKIRQIIDNEDPKKPFSDEKIAKILKASNINIARRTVAKYREQMDIPVARLRKQI